MKLHLDEETLAVLKLQRTNLNQNGNIEDEIRRDISVDYELLKDHIPLETEKWMDIGCGLGLIDVMIWNGLTSPKACFLVDKTMIQSNKRLVGFGDTDSFGYYNNLIKTKEIATMNGVIGAQVIEPEDIQNCVHNGDIDVVISRISWCFHYPYRTYEKTCHDILKPGGVLIVDCRKQHVKDVLRDTRYKWSTIKTSKKSDVLKGIKI